MTELNEIVKKYSILLGVMEQLEEEAPIIEKTYKELKAMIQKQSKLESEVLKKISVQTQESLDKVAEINEAASTLENQYKKIETLVKSAKKQQDDFLKIAETKISELKSLSSTTTPSIDVAEIYSRLSNIESKISNVSLSPHTPFPPVSQEPFIQNKAPTTYSIAKSSFPNGAKHFTFDDIKRVNGKKPYGIVIEGNIIKVQYWTNMLDTVIPYVFKKYKGNPDDLCAKNYGTIVPTQGGSTKFIPYFIKGLHTTNNGQTYRPLSGLNLSVRYCGATETVEELSLLLCNYFHIDKKNIELFYRDN